MTGAGPRLPALPHGPGARLRSGRWWRGQAGGGLGLGGCAGAAQHGGAAGEAAEAAAARAVPQLRAHGGHHHRAGDLAGGGRPGPGPRDPGRRVPRHRRPRPGGRPRLAAPLQRGEQEPAGGRHLAPRLPLHPHAAGPQPPCGGRDPAPAPAAVPRTALGPRPGPSVQPQLPGRAAAPPGGGARQHALLQHLLRHLHQDGGGALGQEHRHRWEGRSVNGTSKYYNARRKPLL